ncbi:MAG TPA: hypothetical protein PKY96_01900 [Flavobacteriales bacterium]|nr:hypothetical protein [Flavobacteriales bacterium]
MNRFSGAVIALTFIAAVPAPACAAPKKEVAVDAERLALLSEADRTHVLDLQLRMDRLIAIDRTEITAEERRALRADWKGMKHEMNELNARSGGTVIYISTAGLIILLLILIILL